MIQSRGGMPLEAGRSVPLQITSMAGINSTAVNTDLYRPPIITSLIHRHNFSKKYSPAYHLKPVAIPKLDSCAPKFKTCSCVIWTGLFVV
jgi:hypothetical protein